MALTKTLAQIKTEVRRKTDQENSGFVTDAELTDYINSAYSEFYDIIVARFEDYYVQDTDSTITSGNKITLPTDFLKLRGLDYQIDTDNRVSLTKFNFNTRNRFRNRLTTSRIYNRQYRILKNEIHILPENNAIGDYTLWYIPAFTALISDTDTVDGFNGWEEYIVIEAAIRVMQKEESDVSVLFAQKNAMLKRIQSAAQNRDLEGIDTVEDVNSSYRDGDDYFGAY